MSINRGLVESTIIDPYNVILCSFKEELEICIYCSARCTHLYKIQDAEQCEKYAMWKKRREPQRYILLIF